LRVRRAARDIREEVGFFQAIRAAAALIATLKAQMPAKLRAQLAPMIANRIGFHLHENVDHAIADGLQRHGVDGTVTSAVGWRRATDDVQWALAWENGRVIVTHDENVLVLHSQGHPHAGMAYCPPDTHPLGPIIQFVR
jgi:hypothetical protein